MVALDREEQAQHVLRVMATDQGRPRLNTTTTVHILVTDVNDNPPQFTHLPASKELNVQVIIILFLQNTSNRKYTEQNYERNTFVFIPIFRELNSKI